MKSPNRKKAAKRHPFVVLFLFFVLLLIGQAYELVIFYLEACPMKKLFWLLLSILIIYVVYFDLTVGTLPSTSNAQVEVNNNTDPNTPSPKTDIPSFTEKVKPGETVISIVEHQLGKSLPVSISVLIKDFQTLNPGKSPEKIQIGSTYHFPDYSN
jgi:hypothetical protein